VYPSVLAEVQLPEVLDANVRKVAIAEDNVTCFGRLGEYHGCEGRLLVTAGAVLNDDAARLQVVDQHLEHTQAAQHSEELHLDPQVREHRAVVRRISAPNPVPPNGPLAPVIHGELPDGRDEVNGRGANTQHRLLADSPAQFVAILGHIEFSLLNFKISIFQKHYCLIWLRKNSERSEKFWSTPSNTQYFFFLN